MDSNDLLNKIIANAKSTAQEKDESENENNNNPNSLIDTEKLIQNLSQEELEILSKLYANEENINKQPKNDNKNFKSFMPMPGFCLKSKNSKNEKVFLNICQSNEITPPKDITEQELMKIIEQNDTENSAFHFRVPMSLGELHTEVDNAGSACTAYDICINPEFLIKIKDNPTFMGFFMSIVFDGLEDKYSIKLDRNCKMLKNKKFMGQIKEQYIRTKSKPLISEMEGKNNTTKNSNLDNNNAQDQKEKLKSEIPKYKIFREPQDGDVVEFLVAEIELPNIISANSLQLDLGEDRILLNTRSGLYFLDIFLPYNINQEECGAQFDKKSKILTITMPVVQID